MQHPTFNGHKLEGVEFILQTAYILVGEAKPSGNPDDLIFGLALTNAVYRIKNVSDDQVISALLISHCSFVKFGSALLTHIVKLISPGNREALRKPI